MHALWAVKPAAPLPPLLGTSRNLVVEGYENGNFLGPTILIGDAGPGIPAYDEEVFGPVLYCVTVETLEEAIQLVNSCTYGNGAYFLSNDGVVVAALVAVAAVVVVVVVVVAVVIVVVV